MSVCFAEYRAEDWSGESETRTPGQEAAPGEDTVSCRSSSVPSSVCIGAPSCPSSVLPRAPAHSPERNGFRCKVLNLHIGMQVLLGREAMNFIFPWMHMFLSQMHLAVDGWVSQSWDCKFPAREERTSQEAANAECLQRIFIRNDQAV